MNSKKIYILLTGLTFLGYMYILASFVGLFTEDIQGCLFHRVTGIPCPSCGSTRGMKELIKGNYSEAFAMNALCYVQALFLLLYPLLLLADLVLKKRWVCQSYVWTIRMINQPFITTVLILFILINWIYLILEGR